MQELKANTEIKVRIGPFADVGDGFTPQIDIALSCDEAELLKHNGAATVDISGNTWAAITDCRGWYDLTLTATDTNAEGQLTVVVQDDSDSLPVFVHFMVLSEAAWDSKYAVKDTGYMDVNVKAIEDADPTDTINAAVDAALDTAIPGEPTEHSINERIKAVDVLTEASGSGDLAAILGDTNELQGDWVNAGRLDALIDLILADTNELQTDWVNAGRLDAILDLILADTGELQTDLANGGRLDLLIDAIKAKTDVIGIPKNVALANFMFYMVLKSDHLTGATGKTIVEEISKDGAAFVACTNTFAEVGSGLYKIDFTQAEMNYNVITLKFTETDCDPRIITIITSQ